MTRASRNQPLEKLGKYRLLGQLGAGAMGTVYKALDTETNREVALKVLAAGAADEPRKLERFRREAKNGAKLRHENIISLYEFGEARGTYFLAMEYVEGIDLEQFIKQEKTIGADDARQILIQLAKALDHAHQAGLVHRDIKPSNILLTQHGDRLVAKLADLGLARIAADEESKVTTDGCTVGTVDYMAPEQARDSHKADIRSDLYSLGCTLYHMLSGAAPFASGSILERVVKHAKEEPADLKAQDASVPADLWATCKRLLAKKPSQRYQTPAELLIDLVTSAESEAQSQLVGKLKRKTVAEADPEHPTAEVPRAGNRAGERVAAGQFVAAQRTLSTGVSDYGLLLLFNCCRLEPGNVVYRQALRKAQTERDATPKLRPWHIAPIRLAYWLAVHAAARLHKPERVLRWGEEVLTCAPRDVGVHLLMADAAAQLEHTELAVWSLEHVLTMEPRNAVAQRSLARLVEAQGNPQRALDLWEAVAKAVPGDSEARRKTQELSVNKTYLWNNQGKANRVRTRPRNGA